MGAPTDTVTYSYGDSNWGDKLTSYDGKTITYDGVGNPLSDGTWTYTWRHGRELSTMTNGTITVRNSYNPDGARIAKIVNRSNGSETHRYTYNGGKLVYDIIRINKEGVISNLTILMSYDESGRPFMITYANVSYYYLLNAQGDVVGIMNVSGDIMVEYTYDAWGNVLSITGPMADTMGQHNQLRYRGYVYDPETGLYFLNSRFYDPEKARFINADAYASTGQGFFGCNMFTYCLNNPLVFEDSAGAAARICISADGTIDDAPWRDHSPSGGGRPYKEYHYQPNKYGNVADKFYTVRFFRAVADPEVIDWVAGIGGLGTSIAGALGSVGVFSIPVVGHVALSAVGIASSLWGIGRLAKWW